MAASVSCSTGAVGGRASWISPKIQARFRRHLEPTLLPFDSKRASHGFPATPSIAEERDRDRQRERMSSWHSLGLEVTYQVLGWVAFCSWSLSFYPQAILNYQRKSVVGLNFDFLVLNLTKHTAYLIYNASLYFSPAVQRQYHQKYGDNEMIPVALNDVAFSTHAVLLTGFTVLQVLIYERGGQRVSKICVAITIVVWASAAGCFFSSSIQVAMTAIKYIPQAFMNFMRKSTVGWSIGNILLDLFGAITSFAKMGIQSLDQHSLVNFYGNIGKTLLSLEVVSSIFYLLFSITYYIPSGRSTIT